MEKAHPRKLDSNLSELIAAAGELAFEHSNSGREAYNLARFALIEIIKNSAHTIDLDKDFEAATSPSRHLH